MRWHIFLGNLQLQVINKALVARLTYTEAENGGRGGGPSAEECASNEAEVCENKLKGCDCLEEHGHPQVGRMSRECSEELGLARYVTH